MRVRARFWVEAVLAAVSAVLAVLTAIWPTWIESLFEVAPDGGSGEAEWWVVVVFVTVALALTVAARVELRRPVHGT